MTQGRKIIERKTVIGRQRVPLADLTKKLSLADTVDAEVGLEVSVEFDDLTGVTGLLDDEIDQERLKADRLCRRLLGGRCVGPATPGRNTRSRIAAAERIGNRNPNGGVVSTRR